MPKRSSEFSGQTNGAVTIAVLGRSAHNSTSAFGGLAMKGSCWPAIAGSIIALAVSGCWQATETVEYTDYKAPAAPADELADDQLTPDQAPKFNADLVHSQ